MVIKNIIEEIVSSQNSFYYVYCKEKGVIEKQSDDSSLYLKDLIAIVEQLKKHEIKHTVLKNQYIKIIE